MTSSPDETMDDQVAGLPRKTAPITDEIEKLDLKKKGMINVSTDLKTLVTQLTSGGETEKSAWDQMMIIWIRLFGDKNEYGGFLGSRTGSELRHIAQTLAATAPDWNSLDEDTKFKRRCIEEGKLTRVGTSLMLALLREPDLFEALSSAIEENNRSRKGGGRPWELNDEVIVRLKLAQMLLELLPRDAHPKALAGRSATDLKPLLKKLK